MGCLIYHPGGLKNTLVSQSYVCPWNSFYCDNDEQNIHSKTGAVEPLIIQVQLEGHLALISSRLPLPIIWNAENRQIFPNRKSISVYLGMEVKNKEEGCEWWVNAKEYWLSFGVDENTLCWSWIFTHYANIY